jgi:beta-ureidopropionase
MSVRIALTETINAYADMPTRLEDLGVLGSRLEDVRRANVAHHIELMRAAKSEGVAAIGFGELFPGPFFALSRDPMWFALAEDALSGRTSSELRAVARELEMIVVAPIYELDPSGRRFNTALVIDEKGELLGTYRKTHLPQGENEQGSFDEPYYYDRSDGKNRSSAANVSKNPYFPVVQTSLARIGVATCYDRHFEGVMSTLGFEGAELVFSPAVTFGAKSERMWQLEFQVDAARHRLFIAGSNRRGSEPPWYQPFFGQSYVTGPNGVLPNLSRNENLVIAEIDLDELGRPDPSGWNLPRDVRHDIYSGPRR